MTLHPFVRSASHVELGRRAGFVRRVSRGRIVATGPLSTVGDICEIECVKGRGENGGERALAQVVAVEDDHIVLLSFDPSISIYPDALVSLRPFQKQAPVGDAFAGRAITSLAQPIDGAGPVAAQDEEPLDGRVLEPMERREPDEILSTGFRAIDGLLSIGRGQRIGIFAASGVGKTTLVRQLAERVDCDRCVICLVGERGREVESFWRDLASREARDRFTCVAATSDVSAVLRARAVNQALCLAEYWRSRGEHVLLILDSITRYAMALREIGLAAGEPPTLRAYPPSVFAALPRVVERCGAQRGGGSVTAIFTVLSESDEVDDPIVEVMKSLLDGHILLSRQLAEQGHFPAIDIPRSVSRLAGDLAAPAHQAAARSAIARLSVYEEARVMIQTGVYKPGANSEIDDAVKSRPALLGFLQQGDDERASLADTIDRLQTLQRTGGGDGTG